MLAHGALRSRHGNHVLLLLLLGLLLWRRRGRSSSRSGSGSSGSRTGSAGSGAWSRGSNAMGRVMGRLMGQVRVLIGSLMKWRSVSKSRVRRKLIEPCFSGSCGPRLGRKVERLGRLGLATDGQKTHTVVVGRHLQ